MGEERLEGLRWEGEPQRPRLGVDSASSPSAPKGIETGFIFILPQLYNHNSILPVELQSLGWDGESQRPVQNPAWAPSEPKGIVSWFVSVCLLQ